MTDEQKTTREEPRVPFKGGPFATIMEKMMNRCVKMMPQMMAMCGGAQDPQHAIHEQPVVPPRPPGIASLARDQFANPLPLRIRQLIALGHATTSNCDSVGGL